MPGDLLHFGGPRAGRWSSAERFGYGRLLFILLFNDGLVDREVVVAEDTVLVMAQVQQEQDTEEIGDFSEEGFSRKSIDYGLDLHSSDNLARKTLF